RRGIPNYWPTFCRIWNRRFLRDPTPTTHIHNTEVDNTTERMEIEGRSHNEVLQSQTDETGHMKNDTQIVKQQQQQQQGLEKSKVTEAELHNGALSPGVVTNGDTEAGGPGSAGKNSPANAPANGPLAPPLPPQSSSSPMPPTSPEALA
ncbi:hypothetical protein CRUP_011821, partial [Coryphaenoides rupestris]